MTEKVKRCPFCGSKWTCIETVYDTIGGSDTEAVGVRKTGYRVNCRYCHSRGGMSEDISYSVRMWNALSDVSLHTTFDEWEVIKERARVMDRL